MCWVGRHSLSDMRESVVAQSIYGLLWTHAVNLSIIKHLYMLTGYLLSVNDFALVSSLIIAVKLCRKFHKVLWQKMRWGGQFPPLGFMFSVHNNNNRIIISSNEWLILAKVVNDVSGGCLFIESTLLLLFIAWWVYSLWHSFIHWLLMLSVLLCHTVLTTYWQFDDGRPATPAPAALLLLQFSVIKLRNKQTVFCSVCGLRCCRKYCPGCSAVLNHVRYNYQLPCMMQTSFHLIHVIYLKYNWHHYKIYIITTLQKTQKHNMCIWSTER